jgi:Domain of unknown function (DUF1083).
MSGLFVLISLLFACPPDTLYVVPRCDDFSINGKGDHPQWEKTAWTYLQKLDKGGRNYATRFKILYSAKGIYVLFEGEDNRITSNYTKDFDKIFKADVFEVFFHPNPDEPLYFEYEVSPLNKELVLFMTNRNQSISGWAPWPYEKNKVRKKVTIYGGAMKPGAAIQSWRAEIFFPYDLLSPFQNMPPVKGTRWKANFCRLDYDSGHMVKWAWAPIDTSFHEYHRYYSLLFD